MDAQKVIEQVPVLANIVRHLNGQPLRKAFEKTDFIILQKGQHVYNVREPANGAYLIICGQVGVVKAQRRQSTRSSPADNKDANKFKRRSGIMIKHDIQASQANAPPAFMKTFGEGEVFGDACFSETDPQPYRLQTAVATAENSDTVLMRFKMFEVYDAVVLENKRWTQEEKTIFFHQNTPTIRLFYTKRFVNKNVDFIKQKRFVFKQPILQEGSDSEDLYVVQEGTLILTKRTKVLGKFYNIQYAVIGEGEMFNE